MAENNPDVLPKSNGAQVLEPFVVEQTPTVPSETEGGVVSGGSSTEGNSLADKLAQTDALINGNTTPAPPSVPISTDNSQGANALPFPSRDPNASTDNLGKLDQLAEQAMREGGFTGYVPPVDNINRDADGAVRLNGAITDMAAGFNYDLAKTLALPVEVVNRGMALMGVDFMEHGKVTQKTVDALNAMGIAAYKVDNLANQIGEGALPALATYAAIQVSAPYMAAQQGVGVASHMAREVGNWAIQHPVVGLWLGQTSSAGGKVVEKKISSNPLAVMGGELLGGAVGSLAQRATSATANFAGRQAGKGLNMLADELPTNFGNAVRKYNPYVPPSIASEAVAAPGINIHTIQNYAENQVAGLKMQMDEAVERAISSIPQSGNSTIQSKVAHSNLLEAEKISNRIVSEAWARTPMNQRIPVKDMRNDIRDFAVSLQEGASGARPNQLIREGYTLTSPMRDPATGRIVAAAPTIRRLRGFISDIRHAIVAEQSSDAPRGDYIRNLNTLRDIVEENISNAIPRDTTIAQARAASQLHHDMFSRGPIADVLAKRFRGDFRGAPGEMVDTLVNTQDGLQAVRDMGRTLTTNRLTTGDEKRILAELQKNIEATIRNGFREAAQNGGPQDAVKYAQKNAYGIKAMARVAAELQLAAGKVSTAMGIKRDIEKSALARFAQTDPEKAVANIFAAANPVDHVRVLMRHFAGDRDAVEGLRNAVVGELMINRAKTDPVKMQDLMKTTRIDAMLREVLSPDQFRRLNRIVSDSIRITLGEDKGFARSSIGKFSILGRIMGATVGRMVNHYGPGGGTIQIPGIFAAQGSKLAERIFKATSPNDMLVNAVLDPKWEQMLYSRLPATVKEMRVAATHYRRLYSVLDTERNDAQKRLSGGSDE